MQWQGSPTYKTSGESWPGYRAFTYTAGESMQATVEVIGSPCTRIIGKVIQNPGGTEMHITSAPKLRIDTTYYNNKLRIEQEQKNA